jgi:MFS family permease
VPRDIRLIASLGTAQTLAWGSTYYLPAVLAESMARDLGIGTSSIFIAFSLGLLVAGLIGPASGRLVDVFGGHRVLPASNLVFALGLGSLAACQGITSLVASWLLIGAGMSAGLYESAFAALARIRGTEARSAITGITLLAGLASTVCWPLSAWMDAELGWRVTCAVWAAVHLVVCLPLNATLPRSRALERRATASQQAGDDTRHRRLTMVALASVFGATWFCSTAMAAHLPRLLQEAGASLTMAIAASALVGPAQVAARLLEFGLVRRIHPLHSARAASLAHPAGAGILLLFGVPAAPIFTLAHGAGNGVMTIANGTLPLVLFGPVGYGLRQGLLMLPARILQAAAPVAFDAALGRYGMQAVLITSAMGVASFCALLCIQPEHGTKVTLQSHRAAE